MERGGTVYIMTNVIRFFFVSGHVIASVAKQSVSRCFGGLIECWVCIEILPK